MMDAVTLEACRVTLQYINICILLHLVGFLLTLIMTDLCTKQPFPIRLLLLVLVDAMLFLKTPFSNTLNHTTELCILCVSPARSVLRIPEIICVEWIQYLEANLWLRVKMYLFFLCQAHAMPSSILLDYLRHEHVMVLGGALSSYL